MNLKDSIKSEIKTILDWQFNTVQFTTTPTKADLTLGKTGVEFKSAVLYTDVRESSKLTQSHQRRTVAKIYNAFLNAMVRVCKTNGGQIRSFNGDSILVFFEEKSTTNPCFYAIKSALQMKYVLTEMLRPAIRQKGYEDNFDIGIGVTYGDIFATKVGIRGNENNQDIIWPSIAVNLAAKLGDKAKYPNNIFISDEVIHSLPSNFIFDYENKISELLGFKKYYWNQDNIQFAGNYINAYKTTYYLEI